MHRVEAIAVTSFVHDETGELCAKGYEVSLQQSLRSGDELVFGAVQSPQLVIATQTSIASIERKTSISLGTSALSILAG